MSRPRRTLWKAVLEYTFAPLRLVLPVVGLFWAVAFASAVAFKVAPEAAGQPVIDLSDALASGEHTRALHVALWHHTLLLPLMLGIYISNRRDKLFKSPLLWMLPGYRRRAKYLEIFIVVVAVLLVALHQLGLHGPVFALEAVAIVLFVFALCSPGVEVQFDNNSPLTIARARARP